MESSLILTVRGSFSSLAQTPNNSFLFVNGLKVALTTAFLAAFSACFAVSDVDVCLCSACSRLQLAAKTNDAIKKFLISIDWCSLPSIYLFQKRPDPVQVRN